jgi:malto-oligosyltrehalose trehalohydrolase
MSMRRSEDGWHRLHVSDAHPGDRYHYRIDGGLAVPEPASRFQPDDVHGPSELVDPSAFDWGEAERDWKGHPWHHAVIYELHVGTFSENGDYASVEARLDHLLELGITMIELMPLADFPGRRNWGYDGALLYAPDASYGRPDDLKHLIRAAHQRGLAVLLDVVYNHFGPEGNYLHCYAPSFFHSDRHTPWGAAINFDGPDAGWVREFFIHNALYWLEEYRFDGLRLDAVDRIEDASRPDILDALAERVRNGPGRDRHIHLILENDHNDARRYQRDDRGRPRLFTAQWNDDLHHALHCLLTGETDGPYQDFGPEAHDSTTALTARAVTEGFAYQGERSAFRDGRPRGTASAHLPPSAVVNFLQNHDQAGNRAFGERLHQLIQPEALDAALALVLLAPSPPLLFMGEEFDATSPFLFFCDFGADLADAVREGRRREFARSARFADPESRLLIPDPNDPATFECSRLDWRWRDDPGSRTARPGEQRRFAHCQRLLALRRELITPLIPLLERGGEALELGPGQLAGRWRSSDGRQLQVIANLSDERLELPRTVAPQPTAERVLDHAPGTAPTSTSTHSTELSPWSVRWTIGPCPHRRRAQSSMA